MVTSVLLSKAHVLLNQPEIIRRLVVVFISREAFSRPVSVVPLAAVRVIKEVIDVIRRIRNLFVLASRWTRLFRLLEQALVQNAEIERASDFLIIRDDGLEVGLDVRSTSVGEVDQTAADLAVAHHRRTRHRLEGVRGFVLHEVREGDVEVPHWRFVALLAFSGFRQDLL